jgi:hypothetical protein
MKPFRLIGRLTAGTVAAVLLSAGLFAAPAQAASAPFYLHNDMNNKCLEILSFNNDNGAVAGMWDCWGGANQHWY